jgi:hypothetical protein
MQAASNTRRMRAILKGWGRASVSLSFENRFRRLLEVDKARRLTSDYLHWEPLIDAEPQ